MKVNTRLPFKAGTPGRLPVPRARGHHGPARTHHPVSELPNAHFGLAQRTNTRPLGTPGAEVALAPPAGLYTKSSHSCTANLVTVDLTARRASTARIVRQEAGPSRRPPGRLSAIFGRMNMEVNKCDSTRITFPASRLTLRWGNWAAVWRQPRMASSGRGDGHALCPPTEMMGLGRLDGAHTLRAS